MNRFDALPLLPQALAFETFALAYFMLARIKSIRGNYAEAYRLLDYLHSVLEASQQTRFLAHVCGEKIRLGLVEQSPARMKAVAQEFGLGERMRRGAWSERRFYDETWERLGLAQAWVLMARGRHGKAHAILETLRASAHDVGYVSRESALLAAVSERFQDLLSVGTTGPGEFADPPSAPLEPLTEREFQMLKLLAQGLSN